MTAHGRLKLSHWIIGTVPTLAEAHACAQALTAEGFADDDLLVESPTTALQQVRVDENSEQREGTLARLYHAFEESATDVGPIRDSYLADARAGRMFVGARDAQGNQIDGVRNLLLAHGASNIYLFEAEDIRHLG
jgi:hypothetical protein